MQHRLEEPAFAAGRPREKVSKKDWPEEYRGGSLIFGDLDRLLTLAGLTLGFFMMAGRTEVGSAAGMVLLAVSVANFGLGNVVSKVPVWVKPFIVLLKAAFGVLVILLTLLAAFVIIILAALATSAAGALGAMLILGVLAASASFLAAVPDRASGYSMKTAGFLTMCAFVLALVMTMLLGVIAAGLFDSEVLRR